MGTTLAAWILVVTLDAAHPQFIEFTSKDNCEAAKALVAQRYNESQRQRNEVWVPNKPDWIPNKPVPVLLAGNPGEVYGAANTNCRAK